MITETYKPKTHYVSISFTPIPRDERNEVHHYHKYLKDGKTLDPEGISSPRIFGLPSRCSCGRDMKYNTICSNCGFRVYDPDNAPRYYFDTGVDYFAIGLEDTSGRGTNRMFPDSFNGKLRQEIEAFLDRTAMIDKSDFSIIPNDKDHNRFDHEYIWGIDAADYVVEHSKNNKDIIMEDWEEYKKTYITTLVPILHPSVRRSVIIGDNTRREDEQTSAIQRLIYKVNLEKKKINPIQIDSNKVNIEYYIVREINHYFDVVFTKLGDSNRKKTIIKNEVIGTQIYHAARGVLTTDITCDIDEVKIGDALIGEMFPEFKNAPIDKINEIIHDKWFLINRPPTLSILSILAFHPTVFKGNTIKLNPFNFNGYNADTDGDVVLAIGLLSKEANEQATQLRASINMFDAFNNKQKNGRDKEITYSMMSMLTLPTVEGSDGKNDLTKNTLLGPDIVTSDLYEVPTDHKDIKKVFEFVDPDTGERSRWYYGAAQLFIEASKGSSSNIQEASDGSVEIKTLPVKPFKAIYTPGEQRFGYLNRSNDTDMLKSLDDPTFSVTFNMFKYITSVSWAFCDSVAMKDMVNRDEKFNRVYHFYGDEDTIDALLNRKDTIADTDSINKFLHSMYVSHVDVAKPGTFYKQVMASGDQYVVVCDDCEHISDEVIEHIKETNNFDITEEEFSKMFSRPEQFTEVLIRKDHTNEDWLKYGTGTWVEELQDFGGYDFPADILEEQEDGWHIHTKMPFNCKLLGLGKVCKKCAGKINGRFYHNIGLTMSPVITEKITQSDLSALNHSDKVIDPISTLSSGNIFNGKLSDNPKKDMFKWIKQQNDDIASMFPDVSERIMQLYWASKIIFYTREDKRTHKVYRIWSVPSTQTRIDNNKDPFASYIYRHSIRNFMQLAKKQGYYTDSSKVHIAI